MKIKILVLIAILFVFNFSFAAPETSTSKVEVPAPEAPKAPKVSSYYGYSYRAFTGISNPGSPVYLKDGDMHLHVLALRYNLSEKWALRVGSAYLIHTLNFTMRNQPMTVNVEGFSDVRTSALYTAFKDKTQSLDFSIGLNVPTAPILKDDYSGRPLPPQDQFSSGTYDIMSVVSYGYNLDQWALNQKMDAVTHTGENSAGYRLGDDFGFTSSVSYSIRPYLVPSFSMRFTDRKDLAINHLANPKSANVHFGSGWEGTLAIRSGMPLKGDQSMRLGFEAGAPVYKTSNTTQYTIGQTLWYVATNVTAAF